jgi:flagellar hook assembly protein FlgD
MLGQKVRTLMNEYQSAGYKSIIWDGKNDYGQSVSSGSYIYSARFIMVRNPALPKTVQDKIVVDKRKYVKSYKMVLMK